MSKIFCECTYISQGRVERGVHGVVSSNDCLIVNCPQSVHERILKIGNICRNYNKTLYTNQSLLNYMRISKMRNILCTL